LANSLKESSSKTPPSEFPESPASPTRQTFLRQEMPPPAETPQARWSFADWRIKRMLFDLVQQGFVADVQTRGRQLAIPIATLKSSLDLFAFGIIFEASHQCLEI